jgi:hypothetical protein
MSNVFRIFSYELPSQQSWKKDAAEKNVKFLAGHPSRKAGPKRRNTSATSSPSRATKSALQAGTRSGKAGETMSRDSNGLAVAQTVLVEIIRYCAVVLRLRWPSSN